MSYEESKGKWITKKTTTRTGGRAMECSASTPYSSGTVSSMSHPMHIMIRSGREVKPFMPH